MHGAVFCARAVHYATVRLAPLPPPNPRILAAARHVTAVRLIGNALTVTAPEIEL